MRDLMCDIIIIVRESAMWEK